MDQITALAGLPQRRIAEDAMAILQSHDWPGNIRQLRNNVERLMILAAVIRRSEISADMLRPRSVPLGAGDTDGGRGREVDELAAPRVRARCSNANI